MPSPNNHGGTTRGMRSVGISFCILVARIALIVFFDSLADSAMGVAVVAALLAAFALNEIESDLPARTETAFPSS